MTILPVRGSTLNESNGVDAFDAATFPVAFFFFIRSRT
jgi:hypothetical protein